MKPVIDYPKLSGDLVRALSAVTGQLAGAGFPKALHTLIDIRVSQINGCQFCLDMHSKEAVAAGVSIARIQALADWRNRDQFTPTEGAALAWAELLTRGGADESARDEALARLRPYFDEAAICRLTFAIATINAWNRMGLAFHRYGAAAAKNGVA